MTDFDALIASWAKAASAKYAPDYVAMMRRQLRAYGKWLVGNALTAESATEANLLEFVRQHNRKNGHTERSLQTFYDQLVEDGTVAANPASKLPPYKRPEKSTLSVLGPEQVNSYLDRSFENIQNPSASIRGWMKRTRVWAMAELIYSSGVSTGQLSEMRPGDLDLRNLSVKIEDRDVPITRQAAWAVGNWQLLDIAHHEAKPTYLFHPFHSSEAKYSTNRIGRDFVAIGLEVGGEVDAGDLRRAFVANMLDRGFSPEKLAYMLGRKSADSLRDIELS